MSTWGSWRAGSHSLRGDIGSNLQCLLSYWHGQFYDLNILLLFISIVNIFIIIIIIIIHHYRHPHDGYLQLTHQNPVIDRDPVLAVNVGLLHELEVGQEPIAWPDVADGVDDLLGWPWFLLDTKQISFFSATFFYRKCKFPMTRSIRLLVGWMVGLWSVCYNFPKWREVTLSRSYQCTCFKCYLQLCICIFIFQLLLMNEFTIFF